MSETENPLLSADKYNENPAVHDAFREFMLCDINDSIIYANGYYCGETLNKSKLFEDRFKVGCRL